jgi:RNA-directed DNA polymerase
MTVTELRSWLTVHWKETRAALDEGKYPPSPVCRVVIPKPDGGERRLKLKVNRRKSLVKRAARATVLGFGFLRRNGGVHIRIDPKALVRMRQRIQRLTGRSWRIAMPERIVLLNRFISGWCAYFALADTPSLFEEADQWLRRRLRQIRWKEWKRYSARKRNLEALGIPMHTAREWPASSKGCWRLAASPPLGTRPSQRILGRP